MRFMRIGELLRLIFGRSSMFVRYTQNARRTIYFSRWEANHYEASKIEPEHITLSLLRDPWISKQFLKDVCETDFRNELHLAPLDPNNDKKTVATPLSNAAKRILFNAGDTADAFLDPHIGNEHLLLGLLQEESSGPAKVFKEKSITPNDLRLRIKKIPRETRKASGKADK
jgi:ATP-dependent Clp protease ATP-binding subunit ClpA